jgi:hypothetical protein
MKSKARYKPPGKPQWSDDPSELLFSIRQQLSGKLARPRKYKRKSLEELLERAIAFVGYYWGYYANTMRDLLFSLLGLSALNTCWHKLQDCVFGMRT